MVARTLCSVWVHTDVSLQKSGSRQTVIQSGHRQDPLFRKQLDDPLIQLPPKGFWETGFISFHQVSGVTFASIIETQISWHPLALPLGSCVASGQLL